MLDQATNIHFPAIPNSFKIQRRTRRRGSKLSEQNQRSRKFCTLSEREEFGLGIEMEEKLGFFFSPQLGGWMNAASRIKIVKRMKWMKVRGGEEFWNLSFEIQWGWFDLDKKNLVMVLHLWSEVWHRSYNYNLQILFCFEKAEGKMWWPCLSK